MPRAGDEQAKQTNEIGAFLPLIDTLEVDLTGKTLTTDALLTQRHLAHAILERQAHYLFTVKANQPTLLEDLTLAFAQRGEPDFREAPTLEHGRIVARSIWTTTKLNDYLDFPGVGQAYVIERHVIFQKSGKESRDLAYGITSHAPDSADAEQVLALNRNHWSIEACHYILDWNWDEDRCRIRTGYGPQNTTRLRRFAIGLIKDKSRDSVSATLNKIHRNIRLVFDYLRMTVNSRGHQRHARTTADRTN
ncbi:MAG: ISAs1 family transposase [Nitrococcus sp.]|nr:ISAs1 family transposase [Nitrococcus sp.]